MKTEISLEAIKNIVEEITKQDILKNTRKTDVVVARDIYMLLAYRNTSKNTTEVTEIVNRDHSTLSHVTKNFDNKIFGKKKYTNWFTLCEKVVKNVKDGLLRYDLEKSIDLAKQVTDYSEIIESHCRSIEELELKLYVEKQRNNFAKTKYKELDDLLRNLHYSDVEGLITRLKPYLTMCNNQRNNIQIAS